MKTVLAVCAVVFLVNAVTIIDAQIQSGFAASFEELKLAMELPWMRMAFGDLLTGFVLVSAWIFYREKDNYLVSVPLVAAYWLVGGNILVSVYIAVIIIRNGGDIQDLLLGRQRSFA